MNGALSLARPRRDGWCLWLFIGMVGVALLFVPPARADVIETDLCIFGATSGGIAAAVQGARMGKRVVIAEPGKFLGGLTTGGLGATDIGNKAAVGGIAREFYERLARHYAQDAAWKFETRQDYFTKRGSGQSKASDLGATNATMWTFEPHVAEMIFGQMLKENDTRVYFQQRLAGVKKVGARLTEFTTEDGSVFRARMFIDATYEGDLMARAKVSYHVGREANAIYGETLNGIRGQTPKHQFIVAVDPYVKPGDPASGLLPFIQSGDGGAAGAGDQRVQTYNYRLCFTTNDANRLPLTPPPGYNPAAFELLGRYFEALVASGHEPKLSEFWNPIWLPNQKTDINNNGGFSTDYIGANYDYPEAGYPRRESIGREHLEYTRGFLTFLATSPRVPAQLRAEMQRWGPCRDEFEATGGWPRQLYVREARRMISDVVMTEHHCRGQTLVDDSVGLAAYNMDSHNFQRIVKSGRVENEGDVQVPPMKPYPISYRSIVPRAGECENLFVPVCLSASHIAYGSIRMEPVFMILGQSAATASAIALDAKSSAQQVAYAKLRARLLADRQVLDWKTTTALVAPSGSLILDDSEAVRKGDWWPGSRLETRLIGDGYIHDGNAHKGGMALTYRPEIAHDGQYEITLVGPTHPNRATNVPVTIDPGDGKPVTMKINQRDSRTEGRVTLGKYELRAGRRLVVTVSNRDTDGYVVADGLVLAPVR